MTAHLHCQWCPWTYVPDEIQVSDAARAAAARPDKLAAAILQLQRSISRDTESAVRAHLALHHPDQYAQIKAALDNPGDDQP